MVFPRLNLWRRLAAFFARTGGTDLVIEPPATDGGVLVRAPRGAAGTQELHISHDGSVAAIENRATSSQALRLTCNNGQINLRATSVRFQVSDLRYIFDTNFTRIGQGVQVGWASTATPNVVTPPDTGFGRPLAKVVRITDGSTGGGTLSSPMISPAQLTGNVNNYNPGVARYYRLSSDAACTITGLSISQVDGQECWLFNVGSNPIHLANLSGDSSSANQFSSPLGYSTTLRPGAPARLVYDGTAQKWRVLTPSLNSRPGFFSKSDGTTIANSAVEASLMGTTVGASTLAGNVLQAGTVLRPVFRGVISSHSSNTGITLTLKLGSTTILSWTMTVPVSQTNAIWNLDPIITCRSAGASGSIHALGSFTVNGSVYHWINSGQLLTNFDTTADLAFDLLAKWATAEVANSISCSHGFLAVVN